MNVKMNKKERMSDNNENSRNFGEKWRRIVKIERRGFEWKQRNALNNHGNEEVQFEFIGSIIEEW